MQNFFISLLFIVAFVSNAFSQTTFDAVLESCKSENNSKQYAKAIEACTEAIKLNPNSDEAYFYRGAAFESLPVEKSKQTDADALAVLFGDYYVKNKRKAEADYQKAVDLKPSSIYYFSLGRVQISTSSLNDMTLAIKNLTESIRVARVNNEFLLDGVYYHRAEAYRRQKIDYDPMDVFTNKPKFEEGQRKEIERKNLAIADYSKFISLYPNSFDSYYGRALTYNSLKKFDLAIADYNFLVKNAVENRKLFLERGKIHLDLKNYEKALADFSKAIEILSADVEGTGKDITFEVYLFRADVYKKLGRMKEACRDLAEIQQEDKDCKK